MKLLLVESNSTGTGRLFARRARMLGAEPVLVAADPGRYAYAAEDGVHCLVADTADPAAVIAAADAAGLAEPAGVASSSEYYIACAAEVARRLGLPGPDPEAIARCRHKGRQRAALAAAGVPVPRHAVAGSVEAAVAAAREIGCPVVVKPVEGSGSVGVTHCTRPEEVAAVSERLLSVRTNERGLAVPASVLVEEHAEGREFSVEVFGGAVVAVVAKHLGPLPHFVEIGHDVPAGNGPADDEALRTVALDALAALGLRWGAAHVEIRLTRAGPRLIEVNPRLAGGMIPELIRSSAGVDLVTAQVAAALGAEPELRPTRSGFAALRFLVADRPCVVDDAAAAVSGACAVPGVGEVRLYRDPGALVGPARDFRDRVGHVRAHGDSARECRRASDAALTALRTALKPLAKGDRC